MKPIRFVFSRDSIFQDVKLETSHLAVRKRDKSGGSVDAEGTGYFDLLVFDEDSLVKFRELFRDARADILSAVSAYTHPVPFVPEYREDDDFGRQRDFALTLAMPDGFNPHMSEALNARIREYLTARIVFRWLETKLPEEAVLFLSRAEKTLTDLKRLLEQRAAPVSLWHGFW